MSEEIEKLLMMFVKDSYKSPTGKVSKQTAIALMKYIAGDYKLEKLVNAGDYKAILKHRNSNTEAEHQKAMLDLLDEVFNLSEACDGVTDDTYLHLDALEDVLNKLRKRITNTPQGKGDKGFKHNIKQVKVEILNKAVSLIVRETDFTGDTIYIRGNNKGIERAIKVINNLKSEIGG